MKKFVRFLLQGIRPDTKVLSRDLQEKESVVKSRLKDLEEKGVILGYRPIVDVSKVYKDGYVSCMIEVKVTPQREVGFDALAERIARFPEVKSLYLVSGMFDLLVIVEGRNIREVSEFVATKLATLDQVQGTATHFLLKSYKENGVTFSSQRASERLKVSF